MDVKQMEYGDGSYPTVLDKGTMDSILCGEASTLNIGKALTEISRVLDPKGTYSKSLCFNLFFAMLKKERPGSQLEIHLLQGVFVSVSHGQPNYRLTYLQRPEYGWDVTVHTVEKPRMPNATIATDDKDNV